MGGSMSYVLAWALGAAVVAGLVTNLLVPPVARLATALRALDHPGSRKLQTGAVPRLGGIAIFGGLATAAAAAAVAQWSDWGRAIGHDELFALVFGTVLVFVVGVLDDLVGVSTAKKFLLELLAAWLLVRVGWSFEVLRLPFLG